MTLLPSTASPEARLSYELSCLYEQIGYCLRMGVKIHTLTDSVHIALQVQSYLGAHATTDAASTAQWTNEVQKIASMLYAAPRHEEHL